MICMMVLCSHWRLTYLNIFIINTFINQNEKLMKKNYFFGALMSLMLVLFALPVKAQVESLADLFGKYQFTADMEVMAGMEKYAEQLSADCEAEISKGAVYDAQIVGFAGATSQMNINAISTEKKMIKATNPNTPQLWDVLYLANENGD